MNGTRRRVAAPPMAMSQQSTTRAIDHLATAAEDQVRQCPFLDGVMLERVTIVEGVENHIAHGLGRKYSGFIEMGQFTTGEAGIRYAVGKADDDKFITLFYELIGADVVVNIWVY